MSESIEAVQRLAQKASEFDELCYFKAVNPELCDPNLPCDLVRAWAACYRSKQRALVAQWNHDEMPDETTEFTAGWMAGIHELACLELEEILALHGVELGSEGEGL